MTLYSLQKNTILAGKSNYPTPFAAKDGLNKEQAVKLCQEFTNIGMRAQIVRSKKKPVPIEEKKKSFWNII